MAMSEDISIGTAFKLCLEFKSERIRSGDIVIILSYNDDLDIDSIEGPYLTFHESEMYCNLSDDERLNEAKYVTLKSNTNIVWPRERIMKPVPGMLLLLYRFMNKMEAVCKRAYLRYAKSKIKEIALECIKNDSNEDLNTKNRR